MEQKKGTAKQKKYFRLIAGIIILVLGIVFMLFPFIPLGYLFVIAGVLLLAYEIPFLQKPLNKIKRKDKKGRVQKVEEKINKSEEVLENMVIEPEKKDENKVIKTD